MAKYTALIDGRGRIQLPEKLLRSMGWLDQQWYVIEKFGEGMLVKMVDAPEPAAAIREVFASHLLPLGEGRGKEHNQYVSRWRHDSGAVVVSENGQPNVWIAKATVDRFVPGAVPFLSQTFEPGAENPGFHSNVASTSGFKDQAVVKFRAGTADAARRLALAIVFQLENLP